MQRSILRKQIVAALVLVLVACEPVGLAASKMLAWQPEKLAQGSPVLFELRAAANTQAVSAAWLGHDIVFFRAKRTGLWYGLAGVPAETVPGTYDLRITEVRASRKPVEIVKKIKISPAFFPKVTVTVPKQFTEPSPEQLSEIAADKDLKQKILSVQSNEKLWGGTFLAPASAPISGVFGTERIFNGEIQSRHQGLDFAVPTGTVVRAINRGTVVLARPLFFEGNFVVLDHGLGLLSLYLHLSEFKVKEGEQVDSGQEIGLSGGTGRASGPHLHLALRWQGVYLDPAMLLKIKVPGD